MASTTIRNFWNLSGLVSKATFYQRNKSVLGALDNMKLQTFMGNFSESEKRLIVRHCLKANDCGYLEIFNDYILA